MSLVKRALALYGWLVNDGTPLGSRTVASMIQRFMLAIAFAVVWLGMTDDVMAQGDPVVLPAGRQVIPMVHTRWLTKDGVPPQIHAIAQTPDGWLWMASTSGLFRFDGVAFSKYRPTPGTSLPTNITRVGVLRDGTLWISPAFGSLYYLRNETLDHFDANNKLPAHQVDHVVSDLDGGDWAITETALLHKEKGGRIWNDRSTAPGLPEKSLFHAVFVDSRGTLWLKTDTAVLRRGRHALRFERVADSKSRGEFQEAPDGSIWASDFVLGSLQRVYTERADPRQQLVIDARHPYVFLIDRRGNFWTPTDGGVIRAELDRKAPKFQGFTQHQGLSGARGGKVLEDKEGNIWVTTEGGIDQFRNGRLKEISLPYYRSYGRPLLAGDNGELWIDHVYLRDPEARQQPFGPLSTLKSLEISLYRDSKGVVWSGALDGLWRVEGLKRVKVPLPPPFDKADMVNIFSIARDTHDGLWLSFGPRGLWRLKDGKWAQHGDIASLAGFMPTTLVAAPDGALWLGSIRNTFVILRDGKVNKFSADIGIDIGTILQIVPSGAGAYLGGESGLAFFDGKRALQIRGENGESFSTASGLVLAPDGTLWANTALGLVSIAPAELRRVAADAAYGVRYRRFDGNDGLKGSSPALTPLPSLVRTSTGELVFSTTSSVFHFHPDRSPTNKVVPAVQVTAVADGRAVFRPAANLKLSASPETVRIDYTALSLSLPHRVQFRYRLEGVDKAWTDAGTRRSAFYTQLAPGRYVFRVIAANDDGLWNNGGAQVAFEVPPTLTQTMWFKLLCAAALALVVWLLHRLRLHIALRRHTLAFEARASERERIARDLHDTLLQSVQGLILSFKRVANRVADDPPTRLMMDQALALATGVLIEGRNKVGGLRTDGETGNLASDLTAQGKLLSEQHGPQFLLTCHGATRPLRAAAFHEVLAIGREAIQNAFVHAGAQIVNVDLEYSADSFTLLVRDDGRGIEPQYRAGRSGHWGIRGMGERAAILGASLNLASGEGMGCAWRLDIPALTAYASDAGTSDPDGAAPDASTVENAVAGRSKTSLP
ncbi:triple tyrosine motif-containing protein [Massilia niabensis]|uniref:Triple tyrosine motif-containing protein n=1 Tax=Massilia niabensis TaxID=544910 RepID=A0ABW0L4Z9_9BURK